MRTVMAIFRREIGSYFASPVAYIVLVVFLVLSGLFFYLYVDNFVSSQYDPRFQFYGAKLNLNDFILAPYFGTISILLLLMVPVLTMRLLAEERKQYTSELLFTAPINTVQIVLGKFFASFFLFFMMLLLSYANVAVLQLFGNPDPFVVLTGYAGLLLVGATFISVGLFASSLTESQIVSAIVSFGILLIFWIMGASAGAEGSVVSYMSIVNHFEAFPRGIIEVRDVVYYLSFTFLGLVLTSVVVDSERWR